MDLFDGSGSKKLCEFRGQWYQCWIDYIKLLKDIIGAGSVHFKYRYSYGAVHEKY